MCCGFVDPNGAGKTTTLKAILGMVSKKSGDIFLLGKPDGDVSIKKELGVMFDQPYFQEDWTPLDIEKGIKPFYAHWDESEFHKYLSHDAKILLLDEPTGGLDPVARDEILDIMREYLVKDGRTILFSTHITSDLERIADMIVYISNGAISFCGEKDELTAKYCAVRGGKLPEEKRKFAIGLREHNNGYECLMELANIGGLPSDTVTERATIDDVVVYMERSSKNA